MQNIPVRAISNLMAHNAGQRLADLRLKFPEYPEFFDPKYTLGVNEAKAAVEANGPDFTLNPRKTEALLALIDDGLSLINTRIPIIIRALSHRLKTTRQIKLAGGAVAALSSAGVISALAISKPTVALASAILGFLSSLASLVGDHLEKPLVGDQKSISEYLRQILEVDSSSKALSIEIRSGLIDPVKIATKVNEFAAVVREVEVYCGV